MAAQTIEVLSSCFALGAPEYTNARVLAANTAESVTIPDGCNLVNFSGNADFYVRYNGTATVPSGDVTDGTAAELNPALRRIATGDGSASFSIIAPVANTTVTMSFFRG